MPRRRAGLADLVQVRQERQHRLAFPALVHQRFAAAERRAAELEEIANQFLRLRHVRLAVGLFLRPAGAGDKQQLRIGPDGLCVGRRLADADDRRALAGVGKLDGDIFHCGRAGAALARRLAAGINENEPRSLRSGATRLPCAGGNTSG